ncbi:hypothetical protein Tco_0491467 [Tanacetum coccineum]
MENSSATTHSKIGVKNYVSVIACFVEAPTNKRLGFEVFERANRSLREGNKSNGEVGGNTILLTYGTEAVIPAKIGMPTLRSMEVYLTKNDEALEINLDLIEENREQAAH